MLQPDSSGYPQCDVLLLEARTALEKGQSDRAISLCTSCIDSTNSQWAHYVRARARLFLKDTMGYCQDMKDTWKLPKERKLEFTAICTIKDSGTLIQMGLGSTRYPGAIAASKELRRVDSTQTFTLYNDHDTLLVAFDVRGKDTLFTISPIPAEFEGGNDQLNPWLMKQIKYPGLEFEAGIQGWVYVQFVVNEQGQVVDPEIKVSPSDGLSEEVLRVMALMPIWTPARAFGRTVRCLLTLPVIFRLQ